MKKLFSILLIVSFPFVLFAQNADGNATHIIDGNSNFNSASDTAFNFDLFANEKPLDITLTCDLTSFIKNKKEGEYIDALIEIHIDNNITLTKNIQLKARGNFRRDKCFFPPIYLNFKNDSAETKMIKGAYKIKLVTHCSNARVYETYILKEFLAYKLYNVLTDKSFKVRLLNIRYVDTGKKQKNDQQYGFLIEPIELLAKRNNSIVVDPTIIRKENVAEVDADRLALFQYMIANTDWRIKGGHNTKYFKSLIEVTDLVIPVPYDFDFSGFVGASYSFPQTWANVKEVTDRQYLGYCRDNDQAYLDNMAIFEDKKEEILGTIDSFSYLHERARIDLSKYIVGFFNRIKRPDNFLVTLKAECRSRVDF